MSKSRRMTIMATALGSWMAWRFLIANTLPVSGLETTIGVMCLFRPLLDEVSWVSLQAINALSFIRAMIGMSQSYREWGLSLSVDGPVFMGWWIFTWVYLFFVWPYFFIHTYKKTGVYRRMGFSYGEN